MLGGNKMAEKCCKCRALIFETILTENKENTDIEKNVHEIKQDKNE
jgi:hypothetical protein